MVYFMNKMKAVTVSCLFASLLVSCSEPVESVEYYKNNPDQMKRVIKECASKSDGYRPDQNCKNAEDARGQLLYDDVLKMKIGL